MAECEMFKITILWESNPIVFNVLNVGKIDVDSEIQSILGESENSFCARLGADNPYEWR